MDHDEETRQQHVRYTEGGTQKHSKQVSEGKEYIGVRLNFLIFIVLVWGSSGHDRTRAYPYPYQEGAEE